MMALILGTSAVFAQKGRVTQANSFFTSGKLDQAKKMIDEAMKDESCADYVKGFFIKGQIYQAIFESPLDNYKKLSANSLDVAWDAYQEVIKLDVKKKYTKKLNTQYKNLATDYINQAVTAYNKNMFKDAFKYFEMSLQIKADNIYTSGKTIAVDTPIIFNAAVAAQKANDNNNAIKYYKKSLEYNYEVARCYAMLASTLKANGQEEEAVKYLHEGYQKFPSDEYMIVELINYYLLGSEPERAEEFLDAAIKNDPKNASFYRAKGTLYEKMKNLEGAAQMYTKALEIDPKDFAAQYNLGNIKLIAAIEFHKKVQDIVDIEEYNKEVEKVFVMYAETVPFFEKAREINPEDQNTIITLRELYFKLRNKDEKYQAKYDEIDAKYKALGL